MPDLSLNARWQRTTRNCFTDRQPGSDDCIEFTDTQNRAFLFCQNKAGGCRVYQQVNGQWRHIGHLRDEKITDDPAGLYAVACGRAIIKDVYP